VTYGVARGTSVMLLAYYANYFDNVTLQQEFRQEYGFSLNPWTWNKLEPAGRREPVLHLSPHN
jgi:multiple sugar transport system substrate-binding protein